MTTYDNRWDGEPVAADDPLLQDLQRIHAVPVPELRFAPAAAVGQARGGLRPRWRPALAAAGVAAALALFLTAPFGLDQRSRTADAAQAILDRSSAVAASKAPAAAGVSYHLVSVTSNASKSGSVIQTETWYGDPAHLRTESRRDGSVEFGFARDGNEVWLYREAEGKVYAAHAPATEELAQSVRIGETGESLAEFMASLAAGSCSTPRLAGEASVAGRDAYYIEVSPGRGCSDKGAAKLGTGVRRVWVDRETFIPLRTEDVDEAGNVRSRYEVTAIEVGVDLPPQSFRYEAPAGTRVVEVRTLGEAKNVIATGSAAPLSPDKAPGMEFEKRPAMELKQP